MLVVLGCAEAISGEHMLYLHTHVVGYGYYVLLVIDDSVMAILVLISRYG